ncbi:recombinase family protein [Jiella marina]|uniref:recombinase family protein n=1 Tax=Jiella sp. LLJ827 TaxID=2917712 RepID=UPI002101A395|nr:recombinase family protein [Jiella sp. LLJ827]MCQ0989750.1 recombinase family protein [Jiella sp. LLJ827]
MKSELISATHLARKAVVYIRQSTPAQVIAHQESLRLQYALRQRAEELGWGRNDIDIIDTDLGLSGSSVLDRRGFQELTARVSLNEVGLVLSVDVTRLARNCSDWYPLLDICGLRNCLIADRDGVYDPGSSNGRLLLGLKGAISELELHTIRGRLTAGLLAKAERGDLAQMLPVGLVREPGNVVVKDPNVEVQQRLVMLFDSFLRLRSAAKVMRFLNTQGVDLPRRDRYGELHWVRGTVAAVTAILKNPAYAGAFVFGRKRTERVPGNGGRSHKSTRSRDQWRIVVKDRYPAYIDWATFETIQAILRDNRADYMKTKTRGAPRDGQLLLQGIVWCARCGHKMYVRYQHGGEYVCNHLRTQRGAPSCQSLGAAIVDEPVAQAFLVALAPTEIEALSKARRCRQQADEAARAAVEQQVTRKRYQASLAERQYNKVDPDNRLVAAELERRWEAALVELRAAEEALSRQCADLAPLAVLSRTETAQVIALAGRLPQLWADPRTRDTDRKALLRCLVEKIILDRGDHDTAMIRIVWRGGEVSEIAVRRPVAKLSSLERGEEMKRRALELSGTTMPDEEIAAVLTAEGYRSPKTPDRVTSHTVRRIRKQAGWPARKPQSRWRHAPGSIGIAELALRLRIPTKWLYVQIRDGRIAIDRQASGAYLFHDCDAVLQAIRDLRSHRIESVDLRGHQPDYKEHPHG